MPILEFYSTDSHKIYNFFARNIAQTEIIPKCPDNPSYKMERMISTFSITGKTEKSHEDEAIEDPQFLAAMNETEQMLSTIDNDNPDPKQLGATLRKMAEISGEPITDNFNAMMRKLEEGTDPQQIEHEFKDIIDNELSDSDQSNNETSLTVFKKMIRRKQPARDPQLYDFK